jgi:hypothetical protein
LSIQTGSAEGEPANATKLKFFENKNGSLVYVRFTTNN